MLYRTPQGLTSAVRFFDLPATSRQKLELLGPGEVFVDSDLAELAQVAEVLRDQQPGRCFVKRRADLISICRSQGRALLMYGAGSLRPVDLTFPLLVCTRPRSVKQKRLLSARLDRPLPLRSCFLASVGFDVMAA